MVEHAEREKDVKRRMAAALTAMLLCLALLPVKAEAKGQSMYSRCVNAKSTTGWCIVVSRSQHICAVYQKRGRSWKQYASFYCTAGANGCTRSGTFKVGSKSYYRDFASTTAFYWVSLPGSSGGFHTTLYQKGSRNIDTAKAVDKRLRMDLSKGCIRLSRWNAYFIWYYIPKGTKVVFF